MGMRVGPHLCIRLSQYENNLRITLAFFRRWGRLDGGAMNRRIKAAGAAAAGMLAALILAMVGASCDSSPCDQT